MTETEVVRTVNIIRGRSCGVNRTLFDYSDSTLRVTPMSATDDADVALGGAVRTNITYMNSKGISPDNVTGAGAECWSMSGVDCATYINLVCEGPWADDVVAAHRCTDVTWTDIKAEAFDGRFLASSPDGLSVKGCTLRRISNTAGNHSPAGTLMLVKQDNENANANAPRGISISDLHLYHHPQLATNMDGLMFEGVRRGKVSGVQVTSYTAFGKAINVKNGDADAAWTDDEGLDTFDNLRSRDLMIYGNQHHQLGGPVTNSMAFLGNAADFDGGLITFGNNPPFLYQLANRDAFGLQGQEIEVTATTFSLNGTPV